MDVQPRLPALSGTSHALSCDYSLAENPPLSRLHDTRPANEPASLRAGRPLRVIALVRSKISMGRPGPGAVSKHLGEKDAFGPLRIKEDEHRLFRFQSFARKRYDCGFPLVRFEGRGVGVIKTL